MEKNTETVAITESVYPRMLITPAFLRYGGFTFRPVTDRHRVRPEGSDIRPGLDGF